MALTLQQFINNWNGLYCEKEDTDALNQCMDLAFAWCDNLGIPRETIRHAYAYQVFENPLPVTTQYFDLIANTPTNEASEGDLIVWHRGDLFHIAIFKSGDVNNFKSFDQNWPIKSKCHIQDHQYIEGVIGWLHPKEQENSSITLIKQKVKLALSQLVLLESTQSELSKQIDSLGNILKGIS